MMTVEALDLEELRTTVRQVLVDRIDLRAVRLAGEQGSGLDRTLWSEMADLGWFGLGVSEADGGLGQGVGALAVIYEELGRSLARVPTSFTVLAARVLSDHASDHLKQRWLPGILRGEIVATIALPQVENDPARGLIAPFAKEADLILVPTRSQPGFALSLVSRDDPGTKLEKCEALDLTRTLESVQVKDPGPETLVLLNASAWARLIDHIAVALAADSVGGAANILERTVEYMKVRRQFDRPIGSFQALQHRVAAWKVRLEAAIALTRQAAELLAADDPSASAVASGAKFNACDGYAAIAGDAVQLHGGIGFTWEHECHLFLKRAKLNQVLLGGSAQHKDRVARLAFGAERKLAA